MQKASSIRFDHTTPFSETVAEIDKLHERIVKVGPLDYDGLLTFFLMNALGEQLPPSVQAKINIPDNSSAALLQYLKDEDLKIRRRSRQGPQPTVLNPTAPVTRENTQQSPQAGMLELQATQPRHQFLHQTWWQDGRKIDRRSPRSLWQATSDPENPKDSSLTRRPALSHWHQPITSHSPARIPPWDCYSPARIPPRDCIR